MTPVREDLQALLADVPWGSDEMTRRVTAYLGGLCRQLGVGMALSFTPLCELGFDAASFIPTAQKLAEIQKLDVAGRSVLLREAWSAAHDGQEPPRGPGYRNWLVDLALEAAYRLRQPETP